MTNRTIQILGQGFGTDPASISVTLAGVEIFSGAVNTKPLADLPSLPNLDLTGDSVLLMEFNVPVNYSGTQAMTCTVTSGVVIFAQILANYQPTPNPVYSSEEWALITDPSASLAEKIAVYGAHAVPPFTPEEIALLESINPVDRPAKGAILESHGVAYFVSGGADLYLDLDGQTDPRDNVTIDGELVLPDHGILPGTWWYQIEEDRTLGYDLTIIAGLE